MESTITYAQGVLLLLSSINIAINAIVFKISKNEEKRKALYREQKLGLKQEDLNLRKSNLSYEMSQNQEINIEPVSEHIQIQIEE